MKVTFHGHSCVQVETDEHSIIIDPFLTGNPLAKAQAGDIKADYILLTHGHNDHVGDTEQIAKNNKAQIIAPFELATYFEWKGHDTHPLHIGGGFDFDFGRVELTQAFHGSAYKLDDEQKIIYMGMPAGILLKTDGKTIYHAGDTALFSDMKLIGELNNVDLAFLPIGDNFTMGPEHALFAAEWVKAKQVVPIHFNTFHPIEQDDDRYVEQLKARGIDGTVLEVGQQLTF
jgi:L-ascorbate metabolism protein UlaG (beta-lactamase superfamily)